MNHNPALHVDCEQCVMQRTSACDDCLVSVVLQMSDGADPVSFHRVGPSEQPMDFDEAEASAIHALAEAGLVPRLRLVPWEDDDGSPGPVSPPGASDLVYEPDPDHADPDPETSVDSRSA